MKLKVVTLNAWNGGVLFEDVVQFLQVQDADVVLLQEVYDGTDPALAPQFRCVQVFCERLGYAAHYFAPAYLDIDLAAGKARSGNAVLSKFPIVRRDAVLYDEPYSETYRGSPETYKKAPRVLQGVVIKTPIGEINVCNLHGIWDVDGDNYSDQRARMADACIAMAHNKAHVILAGDTNARPTNKAIARIETEASLTNVFGRELATTFNMRHKDNPGYATSVVDMLFVSSDIAVLSHDCPAVDISDHLPLVAMLEINAA